MSFTIYRAENVPGKGTVIISKDNDGIENETQAMLTIFHDSNMCRYG